jgi:hypothetical protein
MTNSLLNITNYPVITDELINCLQRDFPNKLPTTNIDNFELGRLVGQQDILEKLLAEKNYNENEYKEDED